MKKNTRKKKRKNSEYTAADRAPVSGGKKAAAKSAEKKKAGRPQKAAEKRTDRASKERGALPKTAVKKQKAEKQKKESAAKEKKEKRQKTGAAGVRCPHWLLHICSLMYLETVLKLFTVKSSGAQEWLLTAAYSAAYGIILALLPAVLDGRTASVLTAILEVLGFAVYTGQLVHYKFYSSFFSLFSLISGTGQVAQFKGAIFRVMAGNILPILLLAVPLAVSAVLLKAGLTAGAKKKWYAAVAAVLALAAALLLPLSLDSSDDRMYSPYNIYYRVNAPFYSVRYFGLAETMLRDTVRFITGSDSSSSVIVPRDDTAGMDSEKEYNISGADLSALADSETDGTIAGMHRYFASVKPTEKNEYTGIFEGKNLIFIVAEALCYGGIDEEQTPTLYKMATEGFNFSRYYTPLYYASTYDGEFMTLLSLLPQDGEWSMYTARNNSLPYSLGNAFGKLGYRTDAYHGWRYDYYYRNETHPNLGYDWCAIGSGLDMSDAWWPPSDVEVVEKSAYRYMQDSPFMVYYLTISGHLEYSFDGNMIAYKNRDRVADMDASDPVRAYFACQKEFDDSLALLLNDLEEAGILDDTVIVITNDHYPYGLMEDELEEFCDYMEEPKFDTHRGVFIVYNSATEGMQVDTVCANIDALPTVSNMFGLEYDSRLMMGTDVMSGEEPVAVFSDRSWVTSRGSYDASTQTFRKARLADIGPDYVESMNRRVYEMFQMSKLIIDNDYYSLVS